MDRVLFHEFVSQSKSSTRFGYPGQVITALALSCNIEKKGTGSGWRAGDLISSGQ